MNGFMNENGTSVIVFGDNGKTEEFTIEEYISCYGADSLPVYRRTSSKKTFPRDLQRVVRRILSGQSILSRSRGK